MKLLSKKNMSEWALEQCLNNNDTKTIRALITRPLFQYYYILVKRRKSFLKKLLAYNEEVINMHLNKQYIRFNEDKNLTFRFKRKIDYKEFKIPKLKEEIVITKVQLLDKEKNVIGTKEIHPLCVNNDIEIKITWTFEE